mgnify:FL=1
MPEDTATMEPPAAASPQRPATPPAPSSRPRKSRRTGKRKLTLSERIEAYFSKLSTKNNFWHRFCSMIWLPYAFRSGIKIKKIDSNTFTAVLPFRRFNRNWYNAMAGAALLGNCEIAGGSFVFGFVGADYTVVCKRLEYSFKRPCFGPAIYRISPQEDVQALVDEGGEFNVTLDLSIYQAISKPGGKEKLVGKSVTTFHVTPKSLHRARKARKAAAEQQLKQEQQNQQQA